MEEQNMTVTDTTESASEEPGARLKLENTQNNLRKLQKEDRTVYLNLGKVAEQAGLEHKDKVVYDFDEEIGSIVLIEAEKEDGEWPDDANTVMTDSRVNLPSSVLSLLGINPSEYDPMFDPLVFWLEPYPDEEGSLSAVEVDPLGFASGILDEDGRLLPVEDRNPDGEEGGWNPSEEGFPTMETDSARSVYEVGLGEDVVQMVADSRSIELDELWETLEEIATLDEAFFDDREQDPSITGDGRSVFFPTSGTWDEIARHLDLPEDHVAAAKMAHNKEADLLVSELGLANYFEVVDRSQPVVVPADP
ncbi:hypothetical protein [Halorhabdus rudnickae]|uniref:hypothetical protein n=1 Tax=Halorhabdus rudnickae TaxID=1775544 RepID=UPI0010848141|nr:hypothetical protein [Halorhabdus rudnickae]